MRQEINSVLCLFLYDTIKSSYAIIFLDNNYAVPLCFHASPNVWYHKQQQHTMIVS